MWWLARAKLKGGRKYYGAYLGGFPERARIILGASINDPVLHVCGGMARFYPYDGGFGRNDFTLDLAPETEPDYLQDAREPFPKFPRLPIAAPVVIEQTCEPWRAILIDSPYSRLEARNYTPGEAAYPTPNILLKNALDALPIGGRVGMIHYMVPSPPRCKKTPKCDGKCKCTKFVFAAGVCCGFNNRIRAFSAFEKLA